MTKSFGEGPVIPVPTCIGNAIHNEIGIRSRELPITPEKVLKKLKENTDAFKSGSLPERDL